MVPKESLLVCSMHNHVNSTFMYRDSSIKTVSIHTGIF